MTAFRQTTLRQDFKDCIVEGEIHQLRTELTQSQVTAMVRPNEKPLCSSPVRSTRTGTEETLRKVIRARANRSKFLPQNLFADPAWDMLLDLYLSDILSTRRSVTSLCGASNVPPSTALRWINTLHREGLVQRESDRFDGRRFFISLSLAGLVRMDRYFESLTARAAQPACVDQAKQTPGSILNSIAAE